MQPGAAECSRVWLDAAGAKPGVARSSVVQPSAAGAQPGAARCSQGAAGGAAGCLLMLTGCPGAQPGAAGAQPGAAGCSQVQQGAARGRCVKRCDERRKAAPQGRTRGAAGVQPAQRVPQGALSDKLRRTSETNKKAGPLPHQEKILLSLIRLRSISSDAKAFAEKLYFSKHTRAPSKF